MRRLLLISAAVIAGAGVVAAAIHGGGIFAQLLQAWNYPQSWNAVVPVTDEEILKKREKEWAGQISRNYERIRAEIDRAKSQGLQTGFLEPKLTEAMRAARQGRYREALMLLDLVEIQIPRKPEKIVPAGERAGAAEKTKNRIKGVPVRSTKNRIHKPKKTQPQDTIK